MPKTAIVLLFLSALPLVGTETQDYEGWNRQRILTALSGLQVSSESECDVEGVPASAWSGMQDQIANLHDGRLSPYDGIVFPNYHYIQINTTRLAT